MPLIEGQFLNDYLFFFCVCIVLDAVITRSGTEDIDAVSWTFEFGKFARTRC